MHPLVGLELSGPTVTPFDDLAPGTGALGRPVWGPELLLRDLELRLGLGGAEGADALRIMRWAARMDGFASRGRFYSASFELDRLGTASAVLDLRDALVDAGWEGDPIPDGGVRLDALAELEAQSDPELPPGTSDRVAAVASALEAEPFQLYQRLTLAEPLGAWSSSWNRVFEAIERAGTVLTHLAVTLPGAPVESDLGTVQRALGGSGASTVGGSVPLRRDGSLVLLSGETSLEVASGVAALLSGEDSRTCVVIRDGDASALDHALWSYGLHTQGLHTTSRWRAPLQVLPLALELAFEPKDPHRVLELLSLPNGPFAGTAGRRMTRAIARSPGVGGRTWKEAMTRLPEPREPILARLAEWVEKPGADALAGAPKDALLEVIERVRAWLVARVPASPEDFALFAAIQQCDALREALDADRRDRFDLVAVRRLSEFVVSSGSRAVVIPELAGRVAHVASAHALWAARETVIWWAFGAREEQAQPLRWRRRELEALQRSGVRFPSTALAAKLRAQGFRRAAQAATKRLILVAPQMVAGQPLRSHPLWDEIVARAGFDAATRRQVTLAPSDLFEDARWRVSSEEVAPLTLPTARQKWTVSLDRPLSFERHSATSLSALFACPLRWVLAVAAGIDSEGTRLPAPHQLAGDLGHRLMEELFAQGAFDVTAEDLREIAARQVDGLFQREGALLLRPGKAHERDQLRRQLVDAACALQRALRDNGLVLLSVERAFEIGWRDGKLSGRWDLLARDDSGRRFIIDMKWGQASYKKALAAGTALQLALYTFALGQVEPSEASAAYFSLSTRSLFSNGEPGLEHVDAVEGPALSETWHRIERTLPLVEQQLQHGRLEVTGLKRSLPLLESLGIPEADQHRHFGTLPKQICEYCRFEVLCGRRWEAAS